MTLNKLNLEIPRLTCCFNHNQADWYKLADSSYNNVPSSFKQTIQSISTKKSGELRIGISIRPSFNNRRDEASPIRVKKMFLECDSRVLLRSLSQAGQRQQQQQYGQLETFLESELKGVITKICPLIRLKKDFEISLFKFCHFKKSLGFFKSYNQDFIIFIKIIIPKNLQF